MQRFEELHAAGEPQFGHPWPIGLETGFDMVLEVMYMVE